MLSWSPLYTPSLSLFTQTLSQQQQQKQQQQQQQHMRRLTTAFMKKPQVPARWCPGIKKEKEKESSENYERWKKQEFFIVTRSGHVSKRNGPVYFSERSLGGSQPHSNHPFKKK